MTFAHSSLNAPRPIFRRRSRFSVFSSRAAVLVLAILAIA